MGHFLVSEMPRDDPGDLASCCERRIGHCRHQPDARAPVDEHDAAIRELLAKSPCRSEILRARARARAAEDTHRAHLDILWTLKAI